MVHERRSVHRAACETTPIHSSPCAGTTPRRSRARPTSCMRPPRWWRGTTSGSTNRSRRVAVSARSYGSAHVRPPPQEHLQQAGAMVPDDGLDTGRAWLQTDAASRDEAYEHAYGSAPRGQGRRVLAEPRHVVPPACADPARRPPRLVRPHGPRHDPRHRGLRRPRHAGQPRPGHGARRRRRARRRAAARPATVAAARRAAEEGAESRLPRGRAPRGVAQRLRVVGHARAPELAHPGVRRRAPHAGRQGDGADHVGPLPLRPEAADAAAR